MQLKVLFVCGGNSCRSQMAEGFLRHRGGELAEVYSAGLRADGLDRRAVEVMAEVGVDISSHSSKTLADLRHLQFDLVVTLCDPAREYCVTTFPAADDTDTQEPSDRTPIRAGVPLQLHWSIQDPALREGPDDEVRQAFRAVRDEVREHVEVLAGHGYLTALALDRQRLERVLDALEDGIVVHDDSRRIFLFNRAAERITGYSRDEVIGRDCHKVFGDEGLCGGQCAFRGDPEHANERHDKELRFTTRDGTDKRLKMAVDVLDPVGDQPHQVIATIRDVTEVFELRRELRERYSFGNMVGVSPAMQDVFERIRQVSASDYPALIMGESGVGKELVARAIHNESRRKGGPFVPINCGALPAHILESELFGHVRGAFTGAVRDRKGRFELADHGTLFLDEIGELDAAFQVKLLRVLQENRFERVGGEKPVQVDVRIISATNRDLREMVQGGQFREDLFYRVAVVPIQLPPLRERQEDIPFLVDKILGDVRQESGREIRGVSDEAMSLFHTYRWPGNVRELINSLRFAVVRCDGDLVEAHHLPLELRQGPPPRGESMDSRHAARAPAPVPRRPVLTRARVQEAIDDAGGNKVQAARRLGIGRATLYRFLARESQD
ncbi:MAG: sigma 54-interacting transcriptional regulator [Pseudomonadota bacterium]